MTRQYPLHVHISTLFVVLTLLVGALIGGLGYRFSLDMLETVADDLTERISRETRAELQRLFSPAEMAASLLGHSALPNAGATAERLAGVPFLHTALTHSDALSSLYLAYPDGDFFFMRRVFNEDERKSLGAPPDTAYVLQIIDRHSDSPGEFRFLSGGLETLHIDYRPEYPREYDPRKRNWYRDAIATGGAVQTAPYVFFSNRKVGTTLATPAAGASGVIIGADILLETLSASLAAQKITPSAQIALLDANGFVIAHEDAERLRRGADNEQGDLTLIPVSDFGVPVLAAISETLTTLGDGAEHNLQIQLGEETWRVSVQALAANGSRLFLVNALPESELLASAFQVRDVSVWVTSLIVLLSIPVTWAIARGLSGPLRTLAREAEAIRRFEFSEPIKVKSVVKEVQELAATMGGMKRTIRRFLDINTAVAGERDFDTLLPRLLSETLSAASAQAGVLYLADDARLTPAAAMRADGKMLAASLCKIDLDAPVFTASNALAGQAVTDFVLSAEDRSKLGLSVEMVAAKHAIGVPLKNREGDLVGALLLLLDKRAEDSLLGFVDALSGSAAVSLENQELIKLQRALFESFVKVIASAIDAKSAYTGGHCGRVPELAKMLARAACDATDGPYRDFDLDAQGWEAVHLAGWLHDCGKVTTPEYVVDKATKLETIYDRIHEIRMRFEVLKRDAEIASLRAIAAGVPEVQAHAHLAVELARLDEEFAFVAECNVGSEYMAPERVEHLRQIGRQTWTRTLDDRIGISGEELARKSNTPAPALPVMEPLLADKREHLIERRAVERLGPDNPWGFRIEVPEHLYNRGELYNLAVSRGTLSEEERYKINEHIVQTEIMLRQLIYPRHLRNVPEIAAGHHEKMDGTGYPKRLTGEQMSPLARMLAIADIFEALTAVDRPYKKGKSLSEAIAILKQMKLNGHIDGELFELFIRSGVYRQYASRYMQAEQIDDVDDVAVLSAA